MTTLSITAGPYTFRARLEEERAPKTCAAFSKLLPFEHKVIHVRRSGESTRAKRPRLPYSDLARPRA